MFDFDDNVPDDPWTKWGVGVFFPSLLAILGALRLAYPQRIVGGYLGYRLRPIGFDLVGGGVLLFACFLFMNARYFWVNTKWLAPHADLGKLVALVAEIVGLGIVITRNVSLI